MFKNILLPIDLGAEEASRKALDVAVDYARKHGSRITVMTVMPGFSMTIISQYFPEGFEEKTITETEKRLKAYIADNIPSEIRTQAILASGTVYEEILETAKKTGCDLIVMAAHRPDLRDFLLGPNAARVVRHANCSVLVVRD